MIYMLLRRVPIESLLFCSFMLICATAGAQTTPLSGQQPATSISKTEFAFKTICMSEGSFGYDIYQRGRLIIHQPTIPGMPGNNGFKDEATAARVAKLVLKKLEDGQMPPSLTVEELQKAKAIH
jgi:hypothetical protein